MANNTAVDEQISFSPSDGNVKQIQLFFLCQICDVVNVLRAKIGADHHGVELHSFCSMNSGQDKIRFLYEVCMISLDRPYAIRQT